MKIISWLILTSFLFGFCGCNAEDDDHFEKLCLQSRGFKVDSAKGSITAAAIMDERLLSFHQVSFPSDTFFLRINYRVDTSMKFFEYTSYKSKQTFTIYSFPLSRSSQGFLFDKAKDAPANFKTVFDPMEKGKTFIQQVEANHILELPTSYDILGYPQDTNGQSFLIQYSNRCKYGALIYENPYQHAGKFREARLLTIFLDYLKREFGF